MAMTGGTAKLVSQGTPPGWPGPVSLYVYYKVKSQSVENNQTVLSLGMYVTTPNKWDIGGWTDFNGSYVGTETSGANCKTFNGTIPNFYGTRWLVENQDVTVTHNSDGTKTATIYWHWGVNSGWSGVMNNPSGSFSVTLTTIPRKSSVRATDANIESATTITINRASSSFTHTLTYSFGGLTGTIASKTSNTSVGWTVPASFYAKIPNNTSGECEITCVTYSGSTEIGSDTCKFTAIADKSKCSPSVTISAVDANSKTIALTGNNKRIVKGVSDVKVTTTATARNSASIKSINVYCGGIQKTGASVTFSGAESNIVYAIVTDSRGYETRVDDKELTLINYVTPTIVPTITRDTPTGDTVTVQAKGLWFNGSFGSVTNTIRVSVSYRIDGTSTTVAPRDMTVTKSGNGYTATTNFTGMDYQKAYRFEITLYDSVYTDGKKASNIFLSKGVPVFDWGEGDFQFNVPVFMKGNHYKLEGADINNLPPGAFCITSAYPIDTGVGKIYSGAFLNIPYIETFSCHVQIILPADNSGVYMRHEWFNSWGAWKKII